MMPDTVIQIAAYSILIALVLALIVSVVLILWLLSMYWIDRLQTQHSIRRNYPLMGRFRYLFEYLGGFFRQYFFSMDREELPFNRAQRSWVYRASKGISGTVAFGSTRALDRPNTWMFVSHPFPSLKSPALLESLVIGEACRYPYKTCGLIHISGMSYGALSAPAISALSQGAAKAGCWLNTGEGGLSPYHESADCDLVFQIGTAKYGVRNDQGQLDLTRLKQLSAKPNIKMFEIKLSQGAKPGKGGILPGAKVSAEVAAIRGIQAGQASVSPNGHEDIRCVDDLLDRIQQIREITGKPVGFKAVLGQTDWLDELCQKIQQRGVFSAPDFISVDGAEGGSGAAPQVLLDYVGLPLDTALPLLVNVLDKYQLRKRIRVIASGKLITPGQVAWALAMGADFVVSARAFMFSLGCIQALQCNKNTCPTGITTNNTALQRGLDVDDKAKRVALLVHKMHEDVAMLAQSVGVENARQLQPHHIYTNDGSINKELSHS